MKQQLTFFGSRFGWCLFLSWAVFGCSADEIDQAMADLSYEVQGAVSGEAVADDFEPGLNLSANPDRNAADEGWMPANYGYSSVPLAAWQSQKFEFHVQLPQTRKALEGFMGSPYAVEYPDAPDEGWHYWQIQTDIGGTSSTELAVRYAGGVAQEYSYIQR